MAFANSYVASILVNDKPQREFNSNGKRMVKMPFNSEYKIRLKNQTSLKTLVNITIDGAQVVYGDEHQIVLNPKQSLDLERFIIELDKGNKFKFVKQGLLGKEGHFDPTTNDLGKIRVEFIPEKEVQLRLGGLTDYRTTYSPPWPHHQTVSPAIFYSSAMGIATNSSLIGGQSNGAMAMASNSISLNNDKPCSETSLGRPTEKCSLGGTVEGSESNQQFVTAQGPLLGWDTSKTTTIEINLSGFEYSEVHEKIRKLEEELEELKRSI